MQSLSLRSKELLPSVLLTLSSIIQALALEVLWSSITSRDDLWTATTTSFITWLQVAAVFQTIVLVWVLYALCVLNIRPVPHPARRSRAVEHVREYAAALVGGSGIPPDLPSTCGSVLFDIINVIRSKYLIQKKIITSAL
jgi:hypothetical protein